MARLFLAALLFFFINVSQAGTFICSKIYSSYVTSYDRGDKSPRVKRTFYQITRNDVVQAYAGNPVFINNTWLTVVMMPPDSISTRAAYAELDLNLSLADSLLISSNLIKMVYSEGQLIETVTDNPPAVGYSSLYLGGSDPPPCF
jgi:hypothetical protein